MSVIHKIENGKPKCGARPRGWSYGLGVTEDDSKVTCRRCKGDAKSRYYQAELTENYIGRIFTYSFGYNMTINVFAKVIKQTAKTLVLKECYCHVENDYGYGEGKAVAGEIKPGGEEYRISRKITSENDRGFWIGGGTRHGWYEWDGSDKYHNTWD